MIARASNAACTILARGLVSLVFSLDRTLARKQGA